MFRLSVIIALAITVFSSWCHAEFRLDARPSLTVDGRYTDNLNLDAEVDDPQSDFVSSMTPGLLLSLEGQYNLFQLEWAPTYSKYMNSPENDAWRQYFVARSMNELAEHLAFSSRSSIVKTEAPLGDIRLTEEDIITDIDPGVTDDTIRKGLYTVTTYTTSNRLTYDFGPEDDMFLSYTFNVREDDAPDGNSYQRHVSGIGGTYWMTDRWGVELGASGTHGIFTGDSPYELNLFNAFLKGMYRFSRNLDGFARYEELRAYGYGEGSDPSDDYITHSGVVGVDYQPWENSEFSFGLGYYKQLVSSERNQEGLFPYVSGRYDMSFMQGRGKLGVRAGSGISESNFGSESLGFQQSMSGSANASYAITKRWLAAADASLSYHDYVNQEPDRQDTIMQASGGFDYILTTWLRAYARYSHRRVDSTQDDAGYSENSILFGITAVSPDIPIIK